MPTPATASWASFALGLAVSLSGLGWVEPSLAQSPAARAASSQTITETSPETITETTAQAPAATPAQPAPAALTRLLSEIDAAASKGDLKRVMQFYSNDFTSTDGLTHDTLEQTLSELWQRYPNLTYRTQLESWEPQANGFSTVTVTTITGSYPNERRNVDFVATITSRQQFEGDRITQQEVLAERSQLSAGDKPPTLTINLPEQVRAGEEFSFDAVVTEPLGDRLLLGTALEEPINAENYLNPAPIELELLNSGGLFKIGEIPDADADRWISAVIVRYDGITAVTQRLRVVGK
jgi:hypothetical protein